LREVCLDDEEIAEPTATAADPQQQAEGQSLASTLHQLLARLPEEQRTAILLREFEGFNSTEISEITGVPAATVRSRIYYGLKALRKMMPEHVLSSTTRKNGGNP
jgi:RNA polymerase sigma-70 factor (ECF subfamily)